MLPGNLLIKSSAVSPDAAGNLLSLSITDQPHRCAAILKILARKWTDMQKFFFKVHFFPILPGNSYFLQAKWTYSWKSLYIKSTFLAKKWTILCIFWISVHSRPIYTKKEPLLLPIVDLNRTKNNIGPALLKWNTVDNWPERKKTQIGKSLTNPPPSYMISYESNHIC